MAQQGQQDAYAQQAEQEMYAADDAQNAQADVIQQEVDDTTDTTANSNQYDYWNQGTRPARTARRRDYGQAAAGSDSRRTFYQSDYYPTPNNGTWTSPDGTFKLATYGQAPAAIIGQRLQDVRLRKQQLAQVAQQFDPYAGIEAVKPQYAKDFNANTQELWNDFLATKIQEHGSRRAALKAIVTPGSEDNWQWRDINRAQNTKGRYINHEVDRAAKDMMDMETGKVRYDEKTHQLAGEVLNALGSYQKGNVGNSKKFEETTRNYERRAEWVSHFKPLDDRVKKFAIERLGPDGVQFDKRGRMMVTSWDDLKYVTDYLDDVADREWETGMWLKDYGSKEEFAKDLKEYYPISVKHNVRTNAIPYPPGGGSGSQPKTFFGGLQQKDWTINGTDAAGGDTKITGSYSVPFMQVVDGRPVEYKDLVTLQMDDGSGRKVRPDRLALNDGGEVVVLASDPEDITQTKTLDKDPAYQKIQMDLDYATKLYDNKKSLYDLGRRGVDKDGASKDYTPEEVEFLRADAENRRIERDALINKKTKLSNEFETRTSKDQEKKAYPVKGNESQLDAIMGGTLQQAIDQLLAKKEQPKTAPATGVVPAAAPKKTYAIGERRTDKNGQEFEKVEGGWKRIK